MIFIDICDHLCNIELPFHWGYILNIQTQVWKTLTYLICTVTNIIHMFRAFFKTIAYNYIIHVPISLLCKQSHSLRANYTENDTSYMEIWEHSFVNVLYVWLFQQSVVITINILHLSRRVIYYRFPRNLYYSRKQNIKSI